MMAESGGTEEASRGLEWIQLKPCKKSRQLYVFRRYFIGLSVRQIFNLLTFYARKLNPRHGTYITWIVSTTMNIR